MEIIALGNTLLVVGLTIGLLEFLYFLVVPYLKETLNADFMQPFLCKNITTTAKSYNGSPNLDCKNDVPLKLFPHLYIIY